MAETLYSNKPHSQAHIMLYCTLLYSAKPKYLQQRTYTCARRATTSGNWLADIQVLLSEMQKICWRCNFFAFRAAKPACRPAIFTGRLDYLLFYHFTLSFPLGSRQEFCISGRKTCMSILLFRFHSVPGRKFLHLGPQNLHVGPPFSPVGRTVYCLTILLFHFHRVPGRGFLHLGRQNLHVGPPFSYYLPFYSFISIRFQAGGVCISGIQSLKTTLDHARLLPC